jgi:hypothetical protein
MMIRGATTNTLRSTGRWIESVLETSGQEDSVNTTTTTTTTTWPIDETTDTSTQPPQLPTSSSTTTQSSPSVIGFVIVAGLFVILLLSMWYILWNLFRFYQQKRYINHRQRETRSVASLHNALTTANPIHDVVNNLQPQPTPPWYRQDESTTILKKSVRIQRRYETIEHWTITKRVQDHTSGCATIQLQKTKCKCPENDVDVDGDVDDELDITSVLSSSSTNDVVEDLEDVVVTAKEDVDTDTSTAVDRECPICLSEFTIGQIVSWSSNPQCIHGTCSQILRLIFERASFVDAKILTLFSLCFPGEGCSVSSRMYQGMVITQQGMLYVQANIFTH